MAKSIDATQEAKAAHAGDAIVAHLKAKGWVQAPNEAFIQNPNGNGENMRYDTIAGIGATLATHPAPGFALVPLRPRTAKMDAVAKHAATSGRYPFEAACVAVGEALKKADLPDIIAGALQTSRAHAWELMRDAVAAEQKGEGE